MSNNNMPDFFSRVTSHANRFFEYMAKQFPEDMKSLTKMFTQDEPPANKVAPTRKQNDENSNDVVHKIAIITDWNKEFKVDETVENDDTVVEVTEVEPTVDLGEYDFFSKIVEKEDSFSLASHGDDRDSNDELTSATQKFVTSKIRRGEVRVVVLEGTSKGTLDRMVREVGDGFIVTRLATSSAVLKNGSSRFAKGLNDFEKTVRRDTTVPLLLAVDAREDSMNLVTLSERVAEMRSELRVGLVIVVLV